MILSMYNQFFIFILTIGLGILTGLLYDFFRIIRKIFAHPNFLIQIEDILYWIIVTFAMFELIINQNDGEIRWFLITGLIVGMVLYFLTISTFIINVMMSLIHIIEKIIRSILFIIFFPIKILLKILFVPINFIRKKIKRKSNNVLKKIRRYVKIKVNRFLNNIKIIFKKV